MNDPKYWDNRYSTAVGAGAGSRGRLYEFKLRTVQRIVDEYKVGSVVDLGCGDGRQLKDLKVKKYRGLDISPKAIDLASEHAGKGRTYAILNEDSAADGNIADMAISLDVLFHLPKGQYEAHLDELFRFAEKYVLIYAPNETGKDKPLRGHMFFSEFVKDVKARFGVEPIEVIKNEFPVVGKNPTANTSYCNFYLFEVKKAKVKPYEREDE